MALVRLATNPPSNLKRLFCLVVALWLCASPVAAPPVAAQPPVLSGLQAPWLAKLEQPGDLTLRDTNLRQALFTISRSWDVNIVVGQDVDGVVNGEFRQAPLREVLEAILLANSYGYRITGQSLVVTRLEGVGDVNLMFQQELVTLRSAELQEVVQAAEMLKSRHGRIQAIPSARSVLIVDFPDRARAIAAFARTLDEAASKQMGGGVGQPLQAMQFAPQFIPAESLVEAIKQILSPDGKASVLTGENRLVVLDQPSRLDLVRRMIEQADVPRPQVHIRALIYDVSLQDLERIGVNWNSRGHGRHDSAGDPQSLFDLNSVISVPTAAGDPTTAFTFMNLSRSFDLTAVLELLCQCKDSRLLADPRVTVVDRETAKMGVVTEIPIQQLTQTAQGGNIGTTTFREAGVTLEVTPFISADGTIQMEVKPTFSRLAGYTSGEQPQPIIDKREAQTTVRVANGQTFVIGGLRQRSEVTDQRGVPVLKDLHFGLGKIFQAHSTDFRESELLVFLRPQIVTPVYRGDPRDEEALAIGSGDLNTVRPARGRIRYPDPCCAGHCNRHNRKHCQICGGAPAAEATAAEGWAVDLWNPPKSPGEAFVVPGSVQEVVPPPRRLPPATEEDAPPLEPAFPAPAEPVAPPIRSIMEPLPAPTPAPVESRSRSQYPAPPKAPVGPVLANRPGGRPSDWLGPGLWDEPIVAGGIDKRNAGASEQPPPGWPGARTARPDAPPVAPPGWR